MTEAEKLIEWWIEPLPRIDNVSMRDGKRIDFAADMQKLAKIARVGMMGLGCDNLREDPGRRGEYVACRGHALPDWYCCRCKIKVVIEEIASQPT